MKQFTVIAAWSLGSLAASAQSMIPGFDVFRSGFTVTGESDMDDDNGSFQVSRFQLMSALSRPVTPAEGLVIIPYLDYRFTGFDLDDTPAGYPIGDEELHSISLTSFLLSNRTGSPWIYGAYARAELASDFEDIGGDDFTFDLAGGAGYRFNERLTLGFGAAVINLNGDTQLFPGVNFDWAVSDKLRVGLYGPTFVVAYALGEDWLISFREDPMSGTWNVTGDDGESRSIDFSSIRLGLYGSRRLTGQLWLTVGAGVTVGNQLDYTRPDGDALVTRDSDASLFGTIGLRVKAW